nr:hypothetical protein [Tanacetum cinerariifolium]
MPPKPNLVFNTAPTAVETNHQAFNVQLSPTKPEQNLSHTTRPVAPIIEDWVSDSEDEFKTNSPQFVPSFVQSSKQVKSLRHSVKPIETTILAATPASASLQSIRSGKRKNKKACFVCKSVDHLIKDCDYHAKKMAQPTPKNYATRVLTQSKPVFNTAVRPVSAVVPKISVTQPRLAHAIVIKSKSLIRGHITRSPSPKTDNSPFRVTAAQALVGNPQHALKDKGVIDSRCSRHMTGNMSYLSDFKEFNGRYVAFGGNPKGGKISGKGKIETCKLDFDDVYFVKELKFNLFSVSQMKGHFSRKCRPGAAEPQRRTVPVETSTSNALVSQCDGTGSYDWSYQAEEEPANYALMAFSSSSSSFDTDVPSCSKACLESVKARLLVYKQNEFVFEENIKLLNIEVQLRDTALVTLRQKLKKAKKERDDLKLKLEKFQTSSKNLTELLASQTSEKTGLGYNSQPIETTIPAVTPAPASPKPNSSGKRKNMKAYFVCKSVDHLIKDCDYHTKKMDQPTLRNYAHRGHHKQYAPLTHTKPQKHMVPTTVLTQSKPVFNTVVRPVSAALPNINVTRPRYAHQVVTKSKSPIRRHITRSPSLKTSNSPPRVTTVEAPVVSVAQGMKGQWGNPQHALKDNGVINSGCSRHIPGNMSYLSKFKELNGGYVTFGGNPKGGKISSKRKIKTDPLGKFKRKVDEGFLVGYSVNSKAFRVFNSRTRIVQETLHVNFLENKPNVASGDPTWLFDIDSLTRTMNYQSVNAGNQTNPSAVVLNQGNKMIRQRKRLKERILLKDGIFISQDKYVAEILRKFRLVERKSGSTPIDTKKPLLKDPDGEDVDVHTYMSMIVKRIFRYLKGKPHLGLWYPKDSPFDLVAYSDSDYAGASLDKKSTTGGCQFLGCRLISWQCKKQTVIATSSTKAEYVAAASLQVKQKKDGIFISQDKYVGEILRKFGLSEGKSASTPIDAEKPLLKDLDGEDVDVHTYRSMIGSLMYLTSSRPDIMFVVCACARFQVTLKVSHLNAVKKIFRYLKGKPYLGLWYPKDSPFDLVAYSDSDYAEAEYVAAASGCAQVLWIQNQLLDYGNMVIEIVVLNILSDDLPIITNGIQLTMSNPQETVDSP